MTGKRILIVLGGIFHDFEGFAAFAESLLVGAGHAAVATYDLDALTRLDQENYDLVLSYTSLSRHREGEHDMHPETLTEAQTDALVNWVRRGGAFLAIHCATVSAKPNPPLRDLIGGIFLSHPPQFTFTVYPMARGHPITSGIEAFTVTDEFYIQEYDPSLDIHMVAIDRGIAHPMAWSKSFGAGRVAYVAMGHSEAVWRLEPYQQLLLQAIDWLTAQRNEEASS